MRIYILTLLLIYSSFLLPDILLAQSTQQGVTFTEVWSPAKLARLTNSIRHASFSSDKLDILKNTMRTNSISLSPAQAVTIMQEFTFSSDMVESIRILDSHIPGMWCDEVINLLKAYSFSSDKLAALRMVKDMIMDSENKQTIISSFTFDSDRAEARRILDLINSRSALTGNITRLKKVLIVVDISRSMSASFTNRDGRVLTRLDFVKEEIGKTLSSMRPNVRFNLVAFSTTSTNWESSLVPATPSNISNALYFLSKLSPVGGTAIYDALAQAYLYTPEVIFFLTDGFPTQGEITSMPEIARKVEEWKNTSPNVKINPVVIFLGSFHGDDKPKARSFMKQLSKITGGIYRSLE